MYCPRAPLGICREFFVSRSEVHALSLTPTREQTVINCSQIGLASPSPGGEGEHLYSNVLMFVAQAI